jgi:WD40 repeat protein
VTDGPRLPASPFKGLAAFDATEADAMLFFGREREREIIAANLLASRVTVLYGASGVGKSSVLRAGVAYHLRELERRNLAEGRRRELAVVVFSSWSGVPVRELRDAVAAELFGDELESEAGPESLTDALERWTNELDVDLYLILDQVDEYFLYRGLGNGAATFDAELPDLVARPQLRVNTVISLREDALASLDFFKARAPNLLGNRLRLEHLDRTAARAAILGPLEAYNRLAAEDRRTEIEPELVEAVLDQVTVAASDRPLGGEHGRERVESPYLQLVMQRLWDDAERGALGRLTLDALDRLGGAQWIVEDHLQDALVPLSPVEQDGAARMFDHLVTPSGTKIAHRVSDLRDYAALSEPDLAKVLERLTGERILRPLPDGPNGEGGRYEIFHDVLAGAVGDWRDRHEAERELEIARRDADRRSRRALLVAATALCALAVVAAIAVFALTQRSEARTEARLAQARALTATALAQLSVDPQRSLRLAVGAARLEQSPDVENALRQALLTSRLRKILGSGGPLTSASFDVGGTRVLTAADDGARLFDARTGALLEVLARGDRLSTASFSRDGMLVVTGSPHGSVRIWDSRSGRLERAFLQPQGVVDASFGPGAKLLATAGADGTVRIGKLSSGRPLRVLRHRDPVDAVDFSPDGELVLTVSNRAARLFATASGRPLHVFPQKNRVTSASFSPDGKVVMTTSQDHTARIWSSATGRPLHVLDEQGSVTDGSFSRDGAFAVTASSDGAARVWKVAPGEKVAVLPGHTNPINKASFSPDGRSVVTASRDRTAKIFFTTSGLVLATLVGHRGSVVGASYAPTGDLVVTASKDGTARLWDPGTEPDLRPIGSHPGVSTVSFSPDGSLAVSASDDGTAKIWRVSKHQLVDVLPHRRPVTSASFSPEGSRVLTTSRDGTARIWRGQTSRVLRHDGPVTGGSFSPDGRFVVTASEDKTARIWNAVTGEALHVLRHREPVTAARFSPDGKLVLTVSADRTARIWSASRGSPMHVLRGHTDQLIAAVFSPHSRLVATASSDATARVWDSRTGAPVHVLSGQSALTSLAFSPDGKLLVTSSIAREPRLWRVATGKPVRNLGGLISSVSETEFSPDGRWVVAAGPGIAALWSTRTGRRLLYLYGPRRDTVLTSVSFSPDGRRIVTSGSDGKVRLYSCEVCPGIDGLVALAKRRLASATRTDH